MRVKTVWTVTGPIKDPVNGGYITTEVVGGEVMGDRSSVASTDLAEMIKSIARENGKRPRDYNVSVTVVDDTNTTYKRLSDGSA
jgi:hypothetical protein